jgi:uncharacterized membrane protein
VSPSSIVGTTVDYVDREGIDLIVMGTFLDSKSSYLVAGFWYTFLDNMGNTFLGMGTSLGIAIGIFALFVLVVVAVHVWATGISLKNPIHVLNKLGAVIELVRHSLFSRVISRQQYSKSDVTPFFRANGYPPYTNLVNWRLKVHGVVEKPLELSLADLRENFHLKNQTKTR